MRYVSKPLEARNGKLFDSLALSQSSELKAEDSCTLILSEWRGWERERETETETERERERERERVC